MINDFIKGINILAKHQTEHSDIYAERDIIYIENVDMKFISASEIQELAALGFYPGADEYSTKYAAHDLEEAGIKVNGDEFEWDAVTEEQWDYLKEDIENSFYYYT